MTTPSNSQTEIERTFLARRIPDEIRNVSPHGMQDMYIPFDSPFATLRLRRQGATYEITKKVPISGADYSMSQEQTVPLDKAEFDALWQPGGRVVTKDRYKVMIDGHQADVDVFNGGLAGLVVIDFEFESTIAMRQFVMPDCCLAEVTQELFIRGGQLAGKRYADISRQLRKYRYQKLFRASSSFQN